MQLVLPLKRSFHREYSEKYQDIDSFELSKSGKIDMPGAKYTFYYPQYSLRATPIRHDYRHLYGGINRVRPPKRRRSSNAIGGRSIEGKRDSFCWTSFSRRSESTKIDEARSYRLGWTIANNVAPRKNLYDTRKRGERWILD